MIKESQIKESHVISKSRPLLAMRNSGYTLGEFKILDTYLSRINPMDASTARVTFSKKEYCQLMGIESGKVRTEQLANYTSHFLGNIVSIPRSDRKKGYIQKVLFTTAEYDEEEELIVLECNPEPLIFETFFVSLYKDILHNNFNLITKFKHF